MGLPNEDDSEEEMDLFDNMSDNDDPEKRVMYEDYFNEGKSREDCDQPKHDNIDEDDEDGDDTGDENKVGDSLLPEKNDLFADNGNDEMKLTMTIPSRVISRERSAWPRKFIRWRRQR